MVGQFSTGLKLGIWNVGRADSSAIVEIVEIWKFWIRREIWLKRHGYWVRRPLEGWKVEGCCWGEQHLTTSQFLVFHFNPLCPTYGGVALCPHVCPTSIIWVYLCKYAYEHIAAQFLHHKVSSFSGKKVCPKYQNFIWTRANAWIYAQCSCRLGQIGLRNGHALLMRKFICLLLFPDRKSSTLSCPPNSFVAFAFSVMNFEVIWKLLKWLLIYCESIWCGVESGLVATCLPKMLLVIIHAQPYNTNQKHSF